MTVKKTFVTYKISGPYEETGTRVRERMNSDSDETGIWKNKLDC